MRIRRLVPAMIVALLSLAQMGARWRPPRDRPVNDATMAAVDRARALGDRGADEWAELEARWATGSVDAQEVAELRIHWAAEGNPMYEIAGWSRSLIASGVQTETAVVLPAALRRGDLFVVDQVLEAYPDGELPVELGLLRTAALWGLGREGNAALVYRDVLRSDPVLAYYEALLEEWIRDRLAEMPTDEQAWFREPDDDYVIALSRELRSRGAPGQLVLWFLVPSPTVSRIAVPWVDLDRGLVAERLDSRREALQACYDDEGGETALGAGTLTLEFEVDPYGAVVRCAPTAGAEFRHADVDTCACGVVRSLRFPCPGDGGRAAVRHPLAYPLSR